MKALLTTLILLISQNLVGQKVALVLSGGGAKGLAHAGAVLALEENNIPIDCIAGTSMGALVGAYYASGFSAKEIVDFATSHELHNWVKNRPKKKYTHLVKNENIDPSWVSLKLSIDSSFSASFRPNLSEDVFLNFGLARKLAPATKYSEGNFDNLFVPFRATASEIFTQKDIVLKSGNLFEAARASMAVPFFYRPIKINNRLLFDGGIYNNFPVEIARYDFDPDVVIGINVASKKVNDYPYSEDESLIAESVLFAILDKTDSSELSLDDIFIDIDLKEHHALDFKEASKIIKLGYQATIKKMPEIKNKINRRVSKNDLSNKRQTFKQNVEDIKFDELKVRGFNKNQSKFVSGQFERIRPISFDQIEDGYNWLVSDDYFVNILPTYDFRQKSTFELYGNSNSKLKGKIGGSLISRNISQLYVGFDLKRLTKVLTHYSLGIQTGRFYQSVDFKSRVQFPGTKRFSIKPEFIYNRWNFTSTTDLFSNGSNPQIQDRYDFSYGLNLEYPVLDKLNLEIHSSIFKNKDRFSNSNTVVSSDTLDVFRLDGQKFRIRLFNNSLNFDQYAFRGQQISLFSKFIFANANYRPGSTSEIQSFRDNESNWFEVGVDFKKYFNLNKTYSLGVSSAALYSTRPVFGTTRLTVLNQSSFDPLQDSKTLILQSLRGRKYLSFGMQSVFHLTTSLHLRLEGYSIYHFEQLQGNSNNSPAYFSDAELVFAGTTGLVFQTLIGPISLSLNYYDQNENRWGALLHIGYLLFNKNSLD